eukprot:7532214-Ditylum_brightwellii.AAC.1
MILNFTIPSFLFKKKHVTIFYHMAREATATKTVHMLKTKEDWNFAGVLMKAQMCKTFGSFGLGM